MVISTPPPEPPEPANQQQMTTATIANESPPAEFVPAAKAALLEVM